MRLTWTSSVAGPTPATEMLSHRERDRLLRAAREARPADMPTVQMPNNIIEFAVSPKFLGLELYPKQATLLKVATLALDSLTDFDLKVLAGSRRARPWPCTPSGPTR